MNFMPQNDKQGFYTSLHQDYQNIQHTTNYCLHGNKTIYRISSDSNEQLYIRMRPQQRIPNILVANVTQNNMFLISLTP